MLYINGKQISDRVLEPGWTDYRKTSFYSVYDVTEEIQEGKNGIGVKLGDGCIIFREGVIYITNVPMAR